MKREDYNDDCPSCEGNGMLATDYSLTLYRCKECHQEYHIHPKKCAACGRWINDNATYCDWHAENGFKDDFIKYGMCITCSERKKHQDYSRCYECLPEGLR